MLSICFKEKVQIPKDALDAMIVGTNFDIRQIIHMMSLWAAGQTKVDSAMVEKESKKSKKEFKLVNKYFLAIYISCLFLSSKIQINHTYYHKQYINIIYIII